MAISLTKDGIPCQSITATHNSTTSNDSGIEWVGITRTYTDNFIATLPIGVICKVVINRVTYSGSGAKYYEYLFNFSLSGTVLRLLHNEVTVSKADFSQHTATDVSVLSSSSFPIGSNGLSGKYSDYGDTVTIGYYLRLE